MSRRLAVVSFVMASACSATTNGYAPPDGGEEPAVQDAAVAPPKFKSDPPGADVVDEKPGAADGVVLVSTRFTQEPSGTNTFQQLWGEVRNLGKQTHCYLRLDLRLTDAVGTEIASFIGFVDAYPYADDKSSSSVPCLAPGARAGIYVSRFVESVPAAGPLSRVWVTFTRSDSNAIPDPAAPLAETAKIEAYAGGERLVGTLRARKLVYDVVVNVYPMVGGIPGARLRATNLEDLDTNATWSFQTDTIKTAFNEYMLFTSYLRGPRPLGMWLSPEGSAYEQFVMARDARAAEHAGRLR